MKHDLSLLAICASALLAGCATVPVSGRSQLSLVSEGTMVSMAADQYAQVKKSTPLSTDKQQTAMIQNAGRRISVAVETYLKANGMGDRVNDFAWEFSLFQSDEVNAWAMPGGKIAFYTGIMEACGDETGVAVVMAHEIGHVVARHGAERFSQQLLTQLGGVALLVALNEQPAKTQALWLGAYGAGATLGLILPYSRTHEYEADKLGITFMAMAGYDPREAVNFWIRMQNSSKGGKPPEFLSTHPSDANRIQRIKAELPAAMTHYRQ